jgi:hypothetical protein
MSMSASGMKDAIKSALQGADVGVIDDDQFDKATGAIAEAIVSYIQSNATVNVTSGSSSGVYPVQ